jgi:membrane-bound lytic murein transglycosylase A
MVAGVSFESVPFTALPGWAADDHAAALRAFVASCRSWRPGGATAALSDLCARAEAVAANGENAKARAFFESAFTPHRVAHAGAGMVTGYYEPVLRASRTRTREFTVPLYKRPPDLVTIVDESRRASAGSGFTHMRQVGDRREPFPTRREIELGAIAGRGLELLWLADPVDAFFLHVQGSGKIEFAGGATTRIGYDGKNGRPYTSIGRVLVDRGEMPLADVTLASLAAYIHADPVRGRSLMWRNESFVFFRELGDGATAPVGAQGVPLSTGRSLAVDAAVHALGTPIYVAAPELAVAPGAPVFQRLMIAQDVGSAIRGPERGDIFFGSGPAAGALAGTTKHAARFYVLLPRSG